MSEVQNFYGFTSDNDESVQGKAGFSGGKFGLNEGNIIKLGLERNAGKDKSEGLAVDLVVKIGEAEMNHRIFPVSKLWDTDGNELEQGSPEWITKAQEQVKSDGAVITHALKALGVAEETIKQVLSTATSFEDWGMKIQTLLPQNFDQRPLHIFLEYQFTLKESAKKTYLILPKNMKGGYFLAPAVGNLKDWTETKEWFETDKDGNVNQKEGLTYVNTQGQLHTFKRNKNYMESNKAIEQVAGQTPANQAAVNQFTPNSGNAAQANWGMPS